MFGVILLINRAPYYKNEIPFRQGIMGSSINSVEWYSVFPLNNVMRESPRSDVAWASRCLKTNDKSTAYSTAYSS